MSIKENLNKIKGGIVRIGETSTSRDVVISALIIFVGVAGFCLGRLSVLEEVRVPVLIEEAPLSASLGSAPISKTGAEPEAVAGGYVASKSGKKYHLPWCSGARTIKEENKIWFATKEEAERAGYTPASNCKGI